MSEKKSSNTSASALLAPVSLTSMAQAAIQQRIVDGQLREGDRLVIDQLARDFGISLIPVREALARLHAEKLVEYNPNKGYRVAPRLSTVHLGELFEARLMIETAVIPSVIGKVGDDDIRGLRELNARIGESETGDNFSSFRRFVELNDSFHLRLVALSGNRPIAEAYKGLSYGPQVAREMSGRGIPDLQDVVREHERIIAALESRDLDATAEAIRLHIMDGLHRLVPTSPQPR